MSKSTKKVTIISLICILLLEVFVFNFKAFRLYLGKYEYHKFNTDEMAFSGLIYIPEWDEYIVTEENPTIEINKINQEIATIKVNMHVSGILGASSSEVTIPIRGFYTDESSRQEYRYFPSKVIVPSLENTKYMACYLNGKSPKLKIMVITDKDNAIYSNSTVKPVPNELYMGRLKIDSIEINSQIPFDFSFCRVIILWLLVLFIYGTTHGFKEPYDDSFDTKLSNVQNGILSVTILLTIMILCVSISLDPSNDMYAKYYTDAVLQGKLNIDYPVSEELSSLEDPYDEPARRVLKHNAELWKMDQCYTLIEEYQNGVNNGENVLEQIDSYYQPEEEKAGMFLWDATYYQEKYYVYFGIIPLLLFYVPFTFLLGIYLPHMVVIVCSTCVTLIFLFKILQHIYAKCFKTIPFFLLWYSVIILFLGSMLLVLTSRGFYYEMSSAVSIMFCVWGVYHVFQLNLDEKQSKQDTIHMTKAALLFALSVGCRPGSVLFFISLIPSIYHKIIRSKQITFKEKCFSLMIIGLPVACIACFLMYINYVRFGSITEFGFRYQLTISNNQNHPYAWIMMWSSLGKYLFGLPRFISTFPFYELQGFESITEYGYSYMYFYYGGIIFLAPITLFLLRVREIKMIEDKNIRCNLKTLLIIAILTLLLLSNMAGVELRYFVEFTWILVLISIVIVWNLYEKIKDENGKSFLVRVVLGMMFIMLYTGLIVQKLCGTSNVMKDVMPRIYYAIRYMICFWE